jgi:hypothetical protein
MNSTTKRLAIQAGIYTDFYSTKELQTFAELIVKECCTMVNAHMQRNNPYDCPLVLDIKERFGVNE